MAVASNIGFIANQTQSSPGLYINTPGQPIAGIPPNMSVMAAISAGLLPPNANVTNFGVTSSTGLGTGGGGRSVLETLNTGDANGVGAAFVASGGSANLAAAGGNSLGAGGLNQTTAPSGAEASIVPANAPSTVPSIPAQPVYRG
jgi:hypothetical protein